MQDKKGLALMIAMGKPRKGMEEEEGKSELSEMASEILDAIETKDADLLGKALKAFIEYCQVPADDD